VKLKQSMTLVILWVILGMIRVPTQAFAADRCSGTAPEAESWVAEKLNEVKMARDSGDYDRSSEQLFFAASGFPRTADISIEPRCMGQQNWRRYLKEKQLTYRELGRRAENAGKKKNRNWEGLSYYIEGDNRKDVERMLNNLPDDPIRHADAGNAIRDNLSAYQWAVDHGFTLIADERTGQNFYQARLDRLIAHSRSRGNALLRAESDIISGDVTEDEEMLETVEESAAAMLGAMAGDESIMSVNEARRDVTRARRSLTQLNEARQWLGWIADKETAPIFLRAVERGDVLLDRANDTSVGLEGRDDYYAAAIRYYAFADADTREATAKSARTAIEPVLEAERTEREAKIEDKANQMQESVRDFQQSIEKSDTEKESFKNEADALEAELDF